MSSSKSVFDRLSDKIKDIFIDSDYKVRSKYESNTIQASPNTSYNKVTSNKVRIANTYQNKGPSKYINTFKTTNSNSPLPNKKLAEKKSEVKAPKNYPIESPCKLLKLYISESSSKSSVKIVKVQNISKFINRGDYERAHRYDNLLIGNLKSAHSSNQATSHKRKNTSPMISSIHNKSNRNIRHSTKDETIATFKPMLVSKSTYNPKNKIESVVKLQISTPLNLTKEEIDELHNYSYTHREPIRIKYRSNSIIAQTSRFHRSNTLVNNSYRKSSIS